MSYEIVKGLKLKRDVKEVWIKASSNNISPKTYDWEEAKGLSMLYKGQGEEELLFTILKLYWDGMFQPGNENNFSKAVKVFSIKYPNIYNSSIGDVKDETIALCPLEDLPKYLNTLNPIHQKIIKARLEGTFDPIKFKPTVIMTKKEFQEELLSIYRNFPKRKKAKHIIGVDGDYFHSTYGPYRYRITCHKENAKVFPSWEDAAIKCRKLNLNTNAIKEA